MRIFFIFFYEIDSFYYEFIGQYILFTFNSLILFKIYVIELDFFYTINVLFLTFILNYNKNLHEYIFWNCSIIIFLSFYGRLSNSLLYDNKCFKTFVGNYVDDWLIRCEEWGLIYGLVSFIILFCDFINDNFN